MIDQLGYLVFEVADLAVWEAFTTRVLGLEVARRWDGGFSLRMAGHAQRCVVPSGPAGGLAAVGGEVADEAGLEALVARLRGAGHDVREASADETAARQVVRLFTLTDPGGLRVELCFGPAMAASPFHSPLARSGFVADA